ncbi:MAG: ActS/PrrB/RegB family redox-sensitive histidine kinase [Alphaproteobacteria bacterium]|nr:ActS/PrrB/RegB family redox-sensitive histidine kinase [Alphaproteobacteria bacterium]
MRPRHCSTMTFVQDSLESSRPIVTRTVSVRTLVVIRWVALAGQVAAIVLVAFGLGSPVPMAPSLSVVAISALLNLRLQMRRDGRERLRESEAAFYLAFDIIQLAVLLYLTGGLENPFALMMLAPVTVSATILGRKSTVNLCLLALICSTVLTVTHFPLPWAEEEFTLPDLYVTGIWCALVIALIFNAAYAWWVAEEARQLSTALAATQQALAREQRMAAMGGIAAAAAHELGSPLATIAVVARELARELPEGSDLSEDVQLLLSESKRCREILASLGRDPTPDSGQPFSAIPVDMMIEQAAAPHQRDDVAVIVEVQDETGDGGALSGDVPMVVPSPELLHGVGAFIQNAVQFAKATVEVAVLMGPKGLTVTIEDDGPGFPITLLTRLGEPYVSGRGNRDGHMGLGVFIATTLLGRTGAKVEFGNRREGGAQVIIRWPEGVTGLAPNALVTDDVAR